MAGLNLKRAQSILEYTLLLAAIIGIIVAVLFGLGNNSISNRLNATYNRMGEVVQEVTDNLTNKIFGN